MDKIQKALARLSQTEKDNIKRILSDLNSGQMTGYDLKKLKGRDDIYRIRKGKLRIIYRVSKDKQIYLLSIERRTDNTYNF